MYYIVFDLEFNQDFTSIQLSGNKASSFPFEIIQIGAVKLDGFMNTVASFDRYVKPTVYSQISPFITELTGITTEQLVNEKTFPEVYHDFIEFIEDSDSVFCIWGKTDMKEIFRNAEYFKLEHRLLPKQFIDLQPYASLHLNQPPKKLLRLQYTVEALEIPLAFPFHNALHDAYYTAEVFKKIRKPSIQPRLYEPIYINVSTKPRQPKRTIDFDALYTQFEKMYERPLTEEERGMIKLAYQMGKTGQFIK